MPEPAPRLIFGVDVAPDGAASPLAEGWPSGVCAPGLAYRWLHFDRGDPGFRPWAESALPPTAAAALLQAETRPRCDALEGGLLLNLRGVNLNEGADPVDMVSLRIWIGADGLVVSTRGRRLFALDPLRAEAEAGRAPASIPRFLVDLAYHLTRGIEAVSLELEEETDELEAASAEGEQPDPDLLSRQRLSAIKLRRFVRPQSEALSTLAEAKVYPIDPDSAVRLREIANRTKRTLEELEAASDRLLVVQDHLDLVTARAQGRNSYALSVVAAIFLPLGFLTGLFGVNLGGIPGAASPYGFLALAVASALIGLGLYAVFRILKWI